MRPAAGSALIIHHARGEDIVGRQVQDAVIGVILGVDQDAAAGLHRERAAPFPLTVIALVIVMSLFAWRTHGRALGRSHW